MGVSMEWYRQMCVLRDVEGFGAKWADHRFLRTTATGKLVDTGGSFWEEKERNIKKQDDERVVGICMLHVWQNWWNDSQES